VDNRTDQAVWIESPEGKRTAVDTGCSFGRANSNSVVLAGNNVSRRHAAIHKRAENEYWLVDLGSANGSYVNGRRVAQPCRLSDGDRIEIASNHFTFHQHTKGTQTRDMTAEQTLQDIRSVECWLLVADIESSTQFARELPADEIPRVTGRWLGQCKQIVEGKTGVINKFLGDGFLGYWREQEGVAASIIAAMTALQKMQEADQPRFRFVLHFGKVLVGGGGSLGEESLLGNEVNFVFRMEKVAAHAGHLRMLSEAAQQRLGSLLATVPDSRREVSGFEGDYMFYTF
jgi:adenylate cyclase